MKLSEIASRLGAELHGDGDAEITGVAGIEQAQPDQLTFVANPKYAGMARTTRASAILVEPEFPVLPTATLRIGHPYLAFARAIELFYTPPGYAPGIHPTAVVHPTASLGKDAHVGAYVVVAEGVVIG